MSVIHRWRGEYHRPITALGFGHITSSRDEARELGVADFSAIDPERRNGGVRDRPRFAITTLAAEGEDAAVETNHAGMDVLAPANRQPRVGHALCTLPQRCRGSRGL